MMKHVFKRKWKWVWPSADVPLVVEDLGLMEPVKKQRTKLLYVNQNKIKRIQTERMEVA